MSDIDGALVGGCRCGRLRFRITTPPLLTMACHCKGCQRMTGSAFSLGVMVAAVGFELTGGAPSIGGLHGEIRHFHCDYCYSWVFTRPDPGGRFVNVRTTMLDDPSGLEPFIETCVDEKLAWATTPATHAFAVFPAPHAWMELLTAYEKRPR